MLISPLRVPISKNKVFVLNLNIYRNAHYHDLNKAKIVYKALMQKQIMSLPFIDVPVIIRYKLYAKTKRKTDVSNVLAIHDKFFCDALTEFKKIKDDNSMWIPNVLYQWGGVCKENPRVEIEIQEN